MSIKPRALILNAPGINCNLETGFAFEQAGADPEQVHISQLRDGERSFDDYEILALSGGFSFGDDVSSGRILGLELRKRFPDDLNRFVNAGKAVLGICNGMQVLVESGLLPDGAISEGSQKTTSLIHNQNNKFECRWSEIFVEDSNCKFMPEETIWSIIEIPSAHQEGLLMHNGKSLTDNKQVVLRFCDDNGDPTEEYPENPNGSSEGITGICNPNGTILGMMPHPERIVTKTQHPNWRRGEGSNPFGAIIFKGIVDYAKER